MSADHFTLKEASEWASNYLGKKVSTSNISYLVQYGRVKKIGNNGNTFISKKELLNYYSSCNGRREVNWKDQLGHDLNWELSFDKYTEAQTTKHVHRLHPYKGKFIPQLVEYFLDSHTDDFKTEVFFKKRDIVFDPFAGSGTTLVQANELGLHAIGVDISEFNCLIGNGKLLQYDLQYAYLKIKKITDSLTKFLSNSSTIAFEEELLTELYKFNNKYFPVPEYKYMVRNKQIDESRYGSGKEKEFLPIYESLVRKYKIRLLQNSSEKFIDKWFSKHVRNEIEFVYEQISAIEEESIRVLAKLILSRTMRSCRATTHADLATLLEPINCTYYCSKHGKICKPLFSIIKWWKTYSKDTLNRVAHFSRLRTNTIQVCLQGDSRQIELAKEVSKVKPELGALMSQKRIKGIFSSPPYIGLIDYHEQHAYAYDLFGFSRRDEHEIGPMFAGQGKNAKESYVKGISEVLINSKKYLSENYDVFLVANDKHGLYPKIAELAGMKIVKQFKRPVLNRTEKDKAAYSEIIFHLKNVNAA